MVMAFVPAFPESIIRSKRPLLDDAAGKLIVIVPLVVLHTITTSELATEYEPAVTPVIFEVSTPEVLISCPLTSLPAGKLIAVPSVVLIMVASSIFTDVDALIEEDILSIIIVFLLCYFILFYI